MVGGDLLKFGPAIYAVNDKIFRQFKGKMASVRAGRGSGSRLKTGRIWTRSGSVSRVFFFHEFLNRVGLDPSGIRLLRHDNRGLAAWRRGTDAFG